MPKTTTGSTSIRLHGSTPGHIVKISEAGHLESVDLETHEDFTALKDTVDANTAALNNKQNTITNTTDLSINDLSLGNTAITPGSTVQYPLLLEQTYVSGGAPQNGFGVGMKFRYSRGYNGGTLPSDQGAIESFFRSGAGSGAPYSGLRFTATDDNSTQELFQVYHTAPNDDGASTMDIGLNATGKLKAESIILSGISSAREHLNLQVGSTVVRGYGMFWFTDTHTDYDMNTLAGKSIRWTSKHVDGSLFTLQGTDNEQIKVTVAGFYEVSFTVFCTSGSQRPNPTIALFKNGTEFTSIAAHSYIRNYDNHNFNTWTASPGIVQMAANDTFVVKGFYTGSGRQGNVYLMNGGGTSFTNVLGSVPIRPYMLIKRISD